MTNTRLKKKRSSGFLTLIAGVMCVVGVVYMMPNVLAFSSHSSPETTSSLPSLEQPKENITDSRERQVAQGAKELFHGLVQFMQDGVGGQSSTNIVSSTQNVVSSVQEDFSKSLDFDDISQDANKQAIQILYERGIVQGNGGKFFPQNYVRVSDFIRVVVDTYRLSNLVGLSESNHFQFSSLPNSVLMRVNTAHELGFLNDIVLTDSEGKSIFNDFITPSLAQKILLNIAKTSSKSVAIDQISFSLTNDFITKSDMAKVLVSVFELDQNFQSEADKVIFTDIGGHPYQSSIETLVKLGIISGSSGKFYPDDFVRRDDFLMMLVDSLLLSKGKTLNISDFYHLPTLLDVSSVSTFAPYAEYCLQSQMCDALLSHSSLGNSFFPDKFITKGEAYDLISSLTAVKFLSADTARRKDNLPRGEFADLLVASFGLTNLSSVEHSASQKMTFVDSLKQFVMNL